MAKGKLFIIEASDGSGKETQTRLLAERLEQDGYSVLPITFPDYAADSSMLVRMYLRGDFGAHADDVNAIHVFCRRPLRVLQDEVGAGLRDGRSDPR